MSAEILGRRRHLHLPNCNATRPPVSIDDNHEWRLDTSMQSGKFPLLLSVGTSYMHSYKTIHDNGDNYAPHAILRTFDLGHISPRKHHEFPSEHFHNHFERFRFHLSTFMRFKQLHTWLSLFSTISCFHNRAEIVLINIILLSMWR